MSVSPSSLVAARQAVHTALDADDLDLALDRVSALAVRDALDDLEARLDEIRDAVDALDSEAVTVLQAWHFRLLGDVRREYSA